MGKVQVIEPFESLKSLFDFHFSLLIFNLALVSLTQRAGIANS